MSMAKSLNHAGCGRCGSASLTAGENPNEPAWTCLLSDVYVSGTSDATQGSGTRQPSRPLVDCAREVRRPEGSSMRSHGISATSNRPSSSP